MGHRGWGRERIREGEEGEDVADGTQRTREGEEQREGEEGEDCADVAQRRGGKGSCWWGESEGIIANLWSKDLEGGSRTERGGEGGRKERSEWARSVREGKGDGTARGSEVR
jgi:hypothetical protein